MGGWEGGWTGRGRGAISPKLHSEASKSRSCNNKKNSKKEMKSELFLTRNLILTDKRTNLSFVVVIITVFNYIRIYQKKN